MKSVGIAALSCLLLGTGVVLWAALAGDPMGGEPVSVVKIGHEESRKTADATSSAGAQTNESIVSPGLMVGGVIGGGFPSNDSVRTVTLRDFQ